MNWLVSRVNASPRLPLRVYLEVGELEVPRRPGQPDMLASNRELRDALSGKGYPIHYSEYAGGHDVACWRGTVADGLHLAVRRRQFAIAGEPNALS